MDKTGGNSEVLKQLLSTTSSYGERTVRPPVLWLCWYWACIGQAPDAHHGFFTVGTPLCTPHACVGYSNFVACRQNSFSHQPEIPQVVHTGMADTLSRDQNSEVYWGYVSSLSTEIQTETLPLYFPHSISIYWSPCWRDMLWVSDIVLWALEVVDSVRSPTELALSLTSGLLFVEWLCSWPQSGNPSFSVCVAA